MVDGCVSRVPVFASLPLEDQRRVEELARPTRLRAGESAYRAGEDLSALIVLHAGRLKILRLAPDGSEQLIRVLGPGDFTGETSVFTGRSPDDFATALEECRLCVFRHEDLDALIRSYPEIGLRLLASVSARLSDAEYRLSSLTSRDVESRLADFLLGLPATNRDGVATVTLPVAKKDLASLLGTTPESLSRALRSLARRGIILPAAGRSVPITAPDRLQQLVDQG